MTSSEWNTERGISSLTTLAVSTVVFILVVSGLYLSGTPLQRTTTSSTTVYSLSADVSNFTIGLQLRLSLNSTALQSGQGVGVNITESNILNLTNNVTASHAWKVSGLALGPCGTGNDPMGVGIFQGYYTESNISSASPLSIYQPGEYACPMFLANIAAYTFQSLSNSAVVSGGLQFRFVLPA